MVEAENMSSISHAVHPLDVELRDLWSRRQELDAAGWVRLYEIVCAVLLAYRPMELSGLSEDKAVYVQDFFHDKVFRPDLLSRLDHAGALRFAYRNYLRDQIKRDQRRAIDAHEPGEAGDEDMPAAVDMGAASSFSEHDDEFRLLTEAGIDPRHVGEVADRWLQASEPWVRIYLGLHFCPDTESSEALYRLAKRLRISSHHYKAEKLGISGNYDGDYGERTMIGRWLTHDLGMPTTPDNRAIILAALKILCLQALLWVEQQEATT